MDLWAWLGENHRQVGAISSALLGCASLVVAIVAVRMNYRNNFGWKPVAFVATYGVESGHKLSRIKGAVEVWNRHKYPIVLSVLRLNYKTAKLSDRLKDLELQNETWRVRSKSEAEYFTKVALEANEHKRFEWALEVEAGNVEPPTVEVRYFDPRRGRMVEAVSKYTNR